MKNKWTNSTGMEIKSKKPIYTLFQNYVIYICNIYMYIYLSSTIYLNLKYSRQIFDTPNLNKLLYRSFSILKGISYFKTTSNKI